MKERIPFLIFTIIACIVSFIHAQHSDVIGCGGFIKSETDINYKVVRVQLITKDGIPIYTTEAAPINGYYMIPVSERGEYVLKLLPPLGWSFEPSQVELNIDGENDACTLNQDINFVFKGFGLAGRVISAGSTSIHSGGPAGVTLSLFQNEHKLNETKSKADGTFEFFDVLPGHYTIKGSHSNWKFLTDISHVQLSKERWEMEQPIVVRGYTLKGNIMHQSSSLNGIDVFLFRASNDDSNLPRPTCAHDGPLTNDEIILLPANIKKENFLCRTRTNGKGEYNFDDVPIGLYAVLPFYSTKSLQIVFVPDQKVLTVHHKDFNIETPFETGAISFYGRVIKSSKSDSATPLSNVQISVDGKHCCQTNNEGLFKLVQVRSSGTIKIKGELDGYTFKEISHNVNLNRLIGTGDSSNLLIITPDKVRVTGRVQCSSTRKQIIRYTDKDKKTLDRFEVEPNAQYSIYVVPGVYIFSPELSDVDIRSGVHLTPEEIEVDASQGIPVEQINFSQLKAKLNGVIHCIDDCQNDLPVLELTSRAGAVTRVDLIPNASKTNELHFEQDNLLPGKYSVTLIKSKQNDKYCWKESQVEVDLSNSNKTIRFEQTGLKLRIYLQTSNKVILQVNQLKDNTFTNSVDLLSGLNEICLPNHGTYELIPSSCMKFENEKYFYDTSKVSSSTPIELIPVEYQVLLSIQADDHEQMAPKFPLLIRNSKQNNEFNIELEKDKSKWTGTFWAKNNEQYSVLPASDTWLFEPHEHTIVVSSDNCQSNQVKFIARRGLFIYGTTNPPVADANVSLYRFPINNQNEPTVEIDGKQVVPILSSFTDANGQYQFGPLSNTDLYLATVQKIGYVFTRSSVSSYDFHSEKLASILAKTKDVDGVFLLLTSSSANMRRKTATTDSTGEVLFTDLQPGKYYLRPQLREYQFKPEDANIDLKSGDEVVVSFQAQRIAFSCYGKITSINNEPEASLIVDAVGIDNCENLPRESAKTDLNGQFRLAALQPGCRYRLQYRSNPGDSSQSDIVQIEPKNQLIDIGENDIHNIHLYTIKRPSDVDVSVYIEAQTQFLSQLKIKLYRLSQRDSPLQIVTLNTSPFAYFNALPFDNETYLLKVESPLSTSVYIYEQPEMTFTTNQTFLFFTFKFEPRLKIYDTETGLSGSYSSFIIALLIILFVFKHETLLPYVRSSYASVRESASSNFMRPTSSIPNSSFNEQTAKSTSTTVSNETSSTTETKRRPRVVD